MILLIDNYDSFTHNLFQALAQLTSEEIRVIRNDAVSVGDIKEMAPSRIVISPGPGTPDDAGISLAVIKEFAEDVPILGVCLGHQVIAQAFGGKIMTANKIVHGKPDRIDIDGRGLFRAINSPADFIRYHSLAVDPETLPSVLEVTARSKIDGEIMGIRHKQYPVEGVQFHPESVASEDGMKLLSNFLNYRREPFEPQQYLTRLIAGNSLNQDEAARFMDEVTEGNLTDAQLAGFLVALNAKGIDPQEIAGCAEVLQRKRVPITVDRPVLDTCGTGGDGKGTFNISSLTALVSATCGATVAKHGNRAVSSRSGSADFYRELGVPVDVTPVQAKELLEKHNFAFLFAPLYHGAMRFAGPARRQLGIKTIMNLLGPLVNPAGAHYQLIGVFAEDYMEIVAQAAVRLGVLRGAIVHGLDGIDEVSVCAPTKVVSFEVGDSVPEEASADDRLAGARFDEFVIKPENYGMQTHPEEALAGGSAAENAELARRVIGVEPVDPAAVDPDDPRVPAIRDAVALNAGLALWVYGHVQVIGDGVEQAQMAISDGKVRETVEALLASGREYRQEVARAG